MCATDAREATCSDSRQQQFLKSNNSDENKSVAGLGYVPVPLRLWVSHVAPLGICLPSADTRA